MLVLQLHAQGYDQMQKGNVKRINLAMFLLDDQTCQNASIKRMGAPKWYFAQKNVSNTWGTA